VDSHDSPACRLGSRIVDFLVKIVDVSKRKASNQASPFGCRRNRRIPDDRSWCCTSVTGSMTQASGCVGGRTALLRLVPSIFATVIDFFEVFHDDAVENEGE
jgi:hypothetical protein